MSSPQRALACKAVQHNLIHTFLEFNLCRAECSVRDEVAHTVIRRTELSLFINICTGFSILHRTARYTPPSLRYSLRIKAQLPGDNRKGIRLMCESFFESGSLCFHT